MKQAVLGTHFAAGLSGGFVKKSLLNLRTEIVLKDVNDVAFWFSFGSTLVSFYPVATGKRRLSLTHQTEAKPRLSSPNHYEWSETNSSGIGAIGLTAAQYFLPLSFLNGRFHFEFRHGRYGGRK